MVAQTKQSQRTACGKHPERFLLQYAALIFHYQARKNKALPVNPYCEYISIIYHAYLIVPMI